VVTLVTEFLLAIARASASGRDVRAWLPFDLTPRRKFNVSSYERNDARHT